MAKRPSFIPGGMPLRGNNLSKAINTKPTTKFGVGESLDVTMTNQPLGKTETSGRSKRKSRNKDGPRTYIPIDLSSDSSTVSGDSFERAYDRTAFFDESRSGPVSFNSNVPIVYNTNQLDNIGGGVEYINSRLNVNMARYHDPLAFTGTYVTSNKVVQHYETIFNRMSREVKMKIRSGSLLSSWTFSNFYKAIHSSIEALELYYTLDSILSYKGSSEIRDKNKGLLLFQESLEDSGLYYAKDKLRRSLKGVWLPQGLSQLIQWTFQNYRVNETEQSLNYRFLPHESFIRCYNSHVVATEVEAAVNLSIGRIQDSVISDIYSILSQVYPSSEIDGLPYSSNSSTYDKLHYEMFANQPTIVSLSDNTQHVFPNDVDFAENWLAYGAISDPKESGNGLPFALQSMWYADTVEGINFFKAFRCTQYTGGSRSERYNTNKFKATSETLDGKLVLRMDDRNVPFQPNETGDVHRVFQEDTGLTVVTEFSSIGPKLQPVYFDFYNGPIIVIREFMDNLFDLK